MTHMAWGGGRPRYVRRVVARVEKLLTQHRPSLPVGFKIGRVIGSQSDWRLEIEVEPQAGLEGWYDCEETFREIATDLNEAFRGDKWYFGIQVRVPHEYLGKLGAEARIEALEQDLDNSRFRTVRLDKDVEHG